MRPGDRRIALWLHYFSIFQPDDTICKLGQIKIVGNHNQSLVKSCSGHFEKPGNILCRFDVKAAGWFISKNNRRLCNQRPCNRRTLLRPAGKHIRIIV